MNDKKISIYNPKHPNYIDITCKPDPVEPYGGYYNPDDEKSLGRCDEKGNLIKIRSHEYVPKNQQGKQKTKYLVNYEPADDAIIGTPIETDEYNPFELDLIKQAYRYVNEENETIINPRWKPYLRLTKEEKRILEEARE